jgi:hypothetical protein
LPDEFCCQKEGQVFLIVIDFNDRSALIIDGQFLVQSLKHQGLRTFGEYVNMYVGVVLRKGVRFRRIDVVFLSILSARSSEINPPPVTTILLSGACQMSTDAKKKAKSSIFPGKERKLGNMILHILHCKNVSNCRTIAVSATDIDVFLLLLHHAYGMDIIFSSVSSVSPIPSRRLTSCS